VRRYTVTTLTAPGLLRLGLLVASIGLSSLQAANATYAVLRFSNLTYPAGHPF
jgi:hypothetical protein